MRAPASITAFAVPPGATPPSTSSTTSWPPRSIISRSARSFGSAAGMKLCPPKPGFTLITSTRSTSPITWRIDSSGVCGLSTTPAFFPSDRICWIVRWRCGDASTWTLITSAPAFAKSST